MTIVTSRRVMRASTSTRATTASSTRRVAPRRRVARERARAKEASRVTHRLHRLRPSEKRPFPTLSASPKDVLDAPPVDDDEDTVFGLPRDTYEPLRTLLASQFVLYLGVGALLPALPLYAQAIGLSSGANGLVISAPAAAMLALNLPLGQAADRYGRKPLMIGGMAVMALADVATARATSVASLVPARVILGVGRCGCECGDRAFLADLCARVPEKRGLIVATQSTVHAIGLVVGPLLGGRLMEAYGAPAAFYYVAAAALGTGIGYCFLPETLTEETRQEAELKASMDDGDGGFMDVLRSFGASRDEDESPAEELLKPAEIAGAAVLEKQKSKASWSELLKTADQRVLLVCASANSLGFVAKLTVIPLYASGHLGASPAEVGNLFSVTALLGLVTAPLSGLAADKFGKKIVAGTALATCAAGLFFGSQSATQSELMLFIGCWGVGVAAAGPAINALAQELAPKGGEGEALTLPKSAADLVFLIGPVALGFADQVVGSDRAGMVLCALSAAVAAASCFFLPTSDDPRAV